MPYWRAELLVEVAGEHLDVAGFVHHLRRRVVLGVDPRHGLDDARGAEQRALLAVHELRQQRVLELDADLAPLLLAEVLDRRVFGVLQRLEARAVPPPPSSRPIFSGSTSIDQSRSVGRVPLRRLRLLVELPERRAAALVVPREDGVEVRVDRVDRRRASRQWRSSTLSSVVGCERADHAMNQRVPVVRVRRLDIERAQRRARPSRASAEPRESRR